MNKHLKTFLLGIGAGIAIALGGILNIVAKAYISNGEISKIVGSFLFPIGLTLVCYLGLNLYTGKIGYLFDNKKDYIGFLGLVYLGNFVGSLIFGFVALAIFKKVPAIYNVAEKIATGKSDIGYFVAGLKVFTGAILCGALVYIAVFCYKKFKNHALKVLGIFIPIAVFVYFGFDHCVANMFYFTFGLSFGCWKSYLNVVLATVGNSIGAILVNYFYKQIILFIYKKD